MQGDLGGRKFSEGNMCSLIYDITAHKLPYVILCDMLPYVTLCDMFTNNMAKWVNCRVFFLKQF